MIAILGFGEQAKAILNYILRKTDRSVVTIDLFDQEVDPHYADRWFHFETSGSLSQSFSLLSDHSDNKITVLNCLPTEYIVEATSLAIERGWNIIDLAGVTEVERKQRRLASQAIDNGSVIVQAAGLAPGIVSSFATDFVKHFGEDIIGIKAYCGGIPKYPEYPLGYLRVFNESGVIKECTGLANTIHECRLVKVPTLSEREHLFIPSLGILEADVTSGGISTTLDRLDVEYFSYKTLRYPGHFDYMKANVLSQPDPGKVLAGLIDSVSTDRPDIVVLHFDVETTEGWESVEFFWEYDYEANLSAMAQATGYIAAEVALQAEEMMPGIYNMDEFDPYYIRKRVREIRQEGNFSKQPIGFVGE